MRHAGVTAWTLPHPTNITATTDFHCQCPPRDGRVYELRRDDGIPQMSDEFEDEQNDLLPSLKIPSWNLHLQINLSKTDNSAKIHVNGPTKDRTNETGDDAMKIGARTC
ncbi:hypothetical protein CBL_04021 [Carabus blaptoides fortunei]